MQNFDISSDENTKAMIKCMDFICDLFLQNVDWSWKKELN